MHVCVTLLLFHVCMQTRSFEAYPDIIRAAGKVDILRDMHDLTGFPNSSVSAIYSSHTLEHSSMANIHTTLRGTQSPIDRYMDG